MACGFAAASCLAASLYAAAPAATSLSPAGLQRGTTQDIAVVGKAGTPPVSAWCSLEGATVVASETGETLHITVPAEAPPGLHWIRLHNAEGSSDPLPFLVGTLPERKETEPNDRFVHEGPVALPAVVNGILQKAGDVDAFAVQLRRGETLVASVDANRALGMPVDPVLQLLSPAGFVLEQNDDHHGADPQIVFLAERDGTYCVRVFGFPAEPNSTINFAGGADYAYRLTLTTGPFINHVAADVRGGKQSLRPVGWNLPQGHIEVDALPGLHRLQPWEDPAGALEVASSEGVPNFRDCTLPATLNGRIESDGHSAQIRFFAAADERLRVVVQAQALGSPLDPVVTLRDDQGKPQKEMDDVSRENRDVELTWAAPRDGEYTVEISDRFGHGSIRHCYRLLVSKDAPRATATLNSSQFLLKRNDSLEIPVTIEREAGFAEQLTFSVEGLPDGIEQEPGISEAEGETSKRAVLKLKAGDAAAFNGPIRIVGRGQAGGPADVTATVRTHLPLLTLVDVWLTVAPAESGQ